MKKVLENMMLKRNVKVVLKILKKNIHLCDSKSGMYPSPYDYERYCDLNEKDLKRVLKLLGDKEC